MPSTIARRMVCISVLLCILFLHGPWMLSLLHIVGESGYSITGLVVGIIFAASLVTVAVITLGILCK